MPGGDAFWLCHECRAEMRPIERNGALTCASCGGDFIEILDEDVNPDPYAELPHPPTRPGQAPRTASPSPQDNPDFFSHMFSSLLNAQPGQQAPPGRGQSSGFSTIASLGSPAAMHGQRPPGQGSGRSYDFNIPGGGSGRIMFGGFGGSSGGGGGFMMGGGGGNRGGVNPLLPLFDPPANPYRTGAPGPPPGGMPQDDLLRGLMEMIADENGMAPQMLFGGMPGFGGPRGASNFGDYVTTQRGFEDVLERLMHAAGPQGPIPATEAVIEGLPRSTFDGKTLEASVYKDCPVCKDDFAVGDEFIRIPCAHIFHPDCLTPWLRQNGSCPVCRFSLVSDGANTPAGTAPAAASSASPAAQPAASTPATGDAADQPESFFTSILNRLWGQGGEARSPTTETAPSASASGPTASNSSGPAPVATSANQEASGTSQGAHADPPDPVLPDVSSAIPDDYRERHRQRERELERQRDLPHDDLD